MGRTDPLLVGSTAASVRYRVSDVCNFLGGVVFLNTVLKVLILKLLLLSVGQSKEPLLCTAWFGKQATGYYFFSKVHWKKYCTLVPSDNFTCLFPINKKGKIC